MARYTEHEGIEPIFISVKEAAKVLGLSPWTVYQLCEKQEIVTQYHGSRRLVQVASLRKYAAELPTEQPKPEQSA